jgi:hypothetical protein
VKATSEDADIVMESETVSTKCPVVNIINSIYWMLIYRVIKSLRLSEYKYRADQCIAIVCNALMPTHF